MPKHAADVPPGTEWRRLSASLWVGTGEHGPVGTVERGRRFNAVDVDGALVGRCRQLQEAQALLEHVADSRSMQAEHSPAA